MALTKLQTRTAVQQLLDDPSAAFWSAPNLDILIGFIYDESWGMILNNSPYFNSQLDTIGSLTAPGYINIATGGALSKRFHRLQTITRAERVYQKADPRDVLIQSNAVVSAPDYTFIFLGDQIWLFPLDTATDVEIRYSFKQPAFTGLADGDSIVWPDGHESVLIFEAAGRASVKGERADPGGFLAIARMARDEMLTYVRKRQHFMSVPWTADTPIDAGGI